MWKEIDKYFTLSLIIQSYLQKEPSQSEKIDTFDSYKENILVVLIKKLWLPLENPTPYEIEYKLLRKLV